MATEKRLIDVDLLVRDIEADPYRTESEKSYDRCLVHRQPTVDAVEVVHGRWEPHPMVPGYVRCSACRDCITYDEWPDGQKWKYCPHCGAKMDGDGNG